MSGLYLAPRFEATPDRLHGCTPWFARLLWLFSYCRCVTVSRSLRRLTISTRRFWIWRTRRLIRFEQLSRIVYRAQAIPRLSPLSYLSFDDSDDSDSAFFVISLALEDGEELALFTVWEQQPSGGDWLSDLAGDHSAPAVGDEAAGSVVEMLQKYLDVPIRSR